MFARLATGLREHRANFFKRFISTRSETADILIEIVAPVGEHVAASRSSSPIHLLEHLMEKPLRTWYQTPAKAAMSPADYAHIDSPLSSDKGPEPELDKVQVKVLREKKRPTANSTKLAMRTERHMARRFNIGETLDSVRLSLLGIFSKKKRQGAKNKRRASGDTRCFGKICSWRRTELAEPYLEENVPEVEFEEVWEERDPILPIGLDVRQTYILWGVINFVTQQVKWGTTFQAHSDHKPFLMVHQTNEYEIMHSVGSFRLNKKLKGKKDFESVAYKNIDPYTSKTIFDASKREHKRRQALFNRKHESLTLQEAYDLANVIVEEFVEETEEFINSIVRYPVVSCDKPVIGVPFKAWFKDVVDIPDYPLEMLCDMNLYLAEHGVQIIDLRCRTEEMISHVPYVMGRDKVSPEVTHSIIRSLDALKSIRHTARFFVVYAFYSGQVPFRFYQAIVRFTPQEGVEQVDWVNDGITRPEIADDRCPSPHMPIY